MDETGMACRKITVRPISGALGAEISDVDLSQDLGDGVADEIHKAFLDHQVIFFRDQALTPQRLVDIARLIGEPAIYPFIEGLAETPEVIEIIKTERDTENFGNLWHSDTTYMECPALGTVLYARETPDHGGDTLYANMYLAYDALSVGMKDLLGSLSAVNSSAQGYRGGRAHKMKQLQGMKGRSFQDAAVIEAEHPVVRTHPETGRKALYVNGSHTTRFTGMTEAESRPLLTYLSRHANRPEFTCRFDWTPGALAIWDNRCTQHLAINDYQGKRRHMQRVTIEGDPPK